MFVQRRWYELALQHLWYHFEFSINSERDLQKLHDIVIDQPFDSRLENGATSLIKPSLSMVRSLFLSINLRGERVNDVARCDAISFGIQKFTVLILACTGLRHLRLDIQPFVPLNAHFSVWEVLQEKNALIEELVRLASLKEYTTLFLDTTPPRWQYEGISSEKIRVYLDVLAPHTTRLRLAAAAAVSSSWIAPLSRLRRIEFDNIGNPKVEACAAFWDTLELIPLDELALSGVVFPRFRSFRNWKCLRSVRLNQFCDIEGAVSTVLRSFPNLRHLALHNPLPSANDYPLSPVTEIICTNLRKLVFTRCRAQKDLLSQVALACPQLQICMPPDNASDLDIISLIDFCPNLTALHIDCCTDLTSASIHHLPRAERLRSLLFNFQHLVSLDEECIFALAENCPDLHSRGFRIATMDRKNEKIQRVMVRQKLSGSSRFKRWFITFATPIFESPFNWIEFDIDKVRWLTHRQGVVYTGHQGRRLA